jgi:hypothetical protein
MENPLFFVLLVLLVAWASSYLYSFQHNRSKLRSLAGWLQDALSLLGSGYNSRWRGSDRLDVVIPTGRGNIREAAIVIGMQSRQLVKAVISLVRRGRDSLTMLISLKDAPVAGREFEIFESKGPMPRNVLLAEGSLQSWEVETYPQNANYQVAFRTQAARKSAFTLLAALQDNRFDLRRLSVRASAPHLMLVLNVGAIPKSDASALLRLVKNLSQDVAQPLKPETSAKSRSKQSSKPGRASQTAQPLLPEDAVPPTPGIDDGLIHNGFHTPNGHHPKE